MDKLWSIKIVIVIGQNIAQIKIHKLKTSSKKYCLIIHQWQNDGKTIKDEGKTIKDEGKGIKVNEG